MCGKTCTKCNKFKPLSDFGKDKRQKYGRRPECKICESFTPGQILKNMKQRVAKNLIYKGMVVTVTKDYIDKLPNICWVCKFEIINLLSIHRKDMSKGYVPGNIEKTHKTCHLSYHAINTFSRNNKGQFARKEGY